ncbi:MAG: hypothetical protein IKX76_01995, partial [Eubacterium sp.]|nr:hypothetical protein [Eubacterium sp.]
MAGAENHPAVCPPAGGGHRAVFDRVAAAAPFEAAGAFRLVADRSGGCPGGWLGGLVPYAEKAGDTGRMPAGVVCPLLYRSAPAVFPSAPASCLVAGHCG